MSATVPAGAPKFHRCGWPLVNGGCRNPIHRVPGQCAGCGGYCDGRHLDLALRPEAAR